MVVVDWNLTCRTREGNRQATGRGFQAKQNLAQGCPTFYARVPGIEHCVYLVDLLGYGQRTSSEYDQDDRLTQNDNPTIYRVKVQDKHLRPYPVTLFTFSAFQPQLSGPKLFFLSDKGGVNNCWSIPAEGFIPVKDSPEQQLALAEKLSVKIPPDPYLTLLAYYKVLERYENVRPWGAKAAFEIGKIYKDLDMPVLAGLAFKVVSQGYSDIQPEADLALIELNMIDTTERLKFENDESKRLALIQPGMAQLNKIAGTRNPPSQFVFFSPRNQVTPASGHSL